MSYIKYTNIICLQKQRWSYANHLWYESKFLSFVNSLHFFAQFFGVCENLIRGELTYKSPHCIVQLIWQHDLKGKEWKRKGRKGKTPESYPDGPHQPEGHGNACWKEKREAVYVKWSQVSHSLSLNPKVESDHKHRVPRREEKP